MLIALIGDIHGNLPALEAVLDSIDAAGIETVLNTGDSVVGYPWPNEVLALLRARRIPTVQGEMDRLASGFLRKAKSLRGKCSPEQYAALEWTYEQLSSANLEYLAELPRQRRLTIDAIELLLCHGTPGGGQTDELHEEDEEELFRRQREVANTRLVVCGGTHAAFHRHVLDSLFVDPGSVGCGPEAVYALLSTEEEPWSGEVQRVEYDYAAVERRMTELGLPRL